ncbi:uncharacterized protein An11g00090 [Aspergillus niger]|uniref:Contig An11c0010, genomic contig n=3 Tax=Aspergillus subgen. Circumdati TaxID=2720871 RepID=A5ABE4_ASPNC|nr:uncharacterized protein An11g00090 [Aspergillus niger]CAK48242.1 unnamed protein product [Aspergillus niger]
MARPDVGQVVAWYICTVAACIFLVFRLIIRWRLLKKLYLDDFFVVAAALCLIGDLGIQHYMFTQASTPPPVADSVLLLPQLIIPGSTLYVTSLWLIKASMVLFYKRLADRTKYQTIYNITLGVLAAAWLVLFFDIVFKCYPPDRQWKSFENPDLTCSEKQSTINYWLTILCMDPFVSCTLWESQLTMPLVNIFSDVFIICLPISQVARLKMPRKQKLGVISVFLLGVIVVITSIIRAIYSHLGEQMITCTVSMIETAIAIIASCLPVLRTLVFGSHSRTGTYSGRRGYELSNSGAAGLASKQHTTVSVSRGGPDELSRHDSEDELVKENMSAEDPTAGISVTREYFVHEGAMERQSMR